MTTREMLKRPVEKRRGAVTQETGSSAYLLVDSPPDQVLDELLKSRVIGEARRDCLKALRGNRLRRPPGSWGMLLRLKGQRWTYLIGDGLQFEWPKEWSARHGWRVAWFSIDGMINTRVARLYEAEREIFNFVCGAISKPEKGFVFCEKVGIESAMIRGEADACTTAWLNHLQSGGEAMDLLAQLADAYLPIRLRNVSEKGKVELHAWDGERNSRGEVDDISDAIERLDLIAFGAKGTIEPTAATLALGKAVHAGDAKAAKVALAAGADPNVMPDDDKEPLAIALSHGRTTLFGEAFVEVTREQQLDLMGVLLEAGARPDAPLAEPAIHKAIGWEGGGDQRVLINQLRLLLDHKADPNAMGTILRSAGQSPLHVVAFFHQWMAVLKLLVSRGADPLLKNRAGRTPREQAQLKLPKAQEPHGQGFGFRASYLESVRLPGVIDFLAAAEQGRADTSGIDELAEASWKEYAEAQRRREERYKADQASLKPYFEDVKAMLAPKRAARKKRVTGRPAKPKPTSKRKR